MNTEQRSITSKQALIVIDIQNDYFPEGKYPQWQAEQVLEVALSLISSAQKRNEPIFLIQHVGTAESPFFAPSTEGVDIHPSILEVAPNAKVIVKQHADAFLNTELEACLLEHAITDIQICGMMTQNCIAFTATSKTADQFNVSVISDACSSIDPMVHGIALRAISDRVSVAAASSFLEQ